MYNLWLTFLIPFLVICLFIYSITSGVKTGVQSISDKTGELFHTLLISRERLLLIRILSNLTPIIAFFIIQFVLLSIHSFGPTGLFDQEKIVTITIWGILFGIFALLAGVLLGLVMGNTTKGLQVTILFVLVSFVSKTVLQINANLHILEYVVPLLYYQPSQYILYRSFVKNVNILSISFPIYPIILILISVILVLVNLIIFNRKDLIDDAGFHISLFKRTQYRIISDPHEATTNKHRISVLIGPIHIIYRFVVTGKNKLKSILFPKNVRNNPFVFWGRIFEKSFPITADFIYSDNMVIFISCLALFFLFPFQISHYPGNAAVEGSINSFGKTAIFSVFTYGHNLSTTPYLWFLSTNTIGIIWIIFLPLSFFWVTKAIRRDANSEYGEIFGGLPLDTKHVAFQRMSAIYIELLILTLITIFLLLFTEVLNGQAYSKEWEIIGIICLLPLYFFIITFIAVIELVFKNEGAIFAGIFIIAVISSFILSFLVPSLNTWYMKGIFSLYDPILVIQKESLVVNEKGLLLLGVMDICSFIGLVYSSSMYKWLNIHDKAIVSNS